MATVLGTKNSKTRKDLYNYVIGPINAAAKASGLVAPFGRNSWVDAGATDATAKWKQVRETARDLSTMFGLPFNMDLSMSTYNKAKDVAKKIQAEMKAQRGADVADTGTVPGDIPLLDPGTIPGGDFSVPTPGSTPAWGTPGSAPTWDIAPITDSATPTGGDVPGGLEGLGTAAKVGMAVGGLAIVTGAVALTVKWWRARQAA